MIMQRLRAAKLLGPAATTAVSIAILLGLGTWQLQRKAWKENLIATIDQRTKAAPVDLAMIVFSDPDGLNDPNGLEYTRVKVRGHFLHDKERYFYAPDAELGPGFNVYTPLETADGKSVVFVNRGYVPDDHKDPATRAQGQLSGEVEVIGLLREPRPPARFTPDNDPKNNLWFWRDIPALAASAFPDVRANVLPAIIDQEATPLGDGPRGGTTIVSLSNRHLEYAITWFGLALALAAVFTLYAAGRLREP